MNEQPQQPQDTVDVLVRGVDARLHQLIRSRTYTGNPSMNEVLKNAVNRGMREWLELADAEGRMEW